VEVPQRHVGWRGTFDHKELVGRVYPIGTSSRVYRWHFRHRGGRDSGLAKEKPMHLPDAKAALVKFVKIELRCERPA
jgi:hypothetical protein